MYTIHAHWDLRWSSNIPAFASELSSSLANVKCYLFVSPAVLCIGKLSKNVEVPVIGQAVIGRDTRPRLTRKSGVGPVGVRVQGHNPSFPQQSLFFFWKAFYSHKYLYTMTSTSTENWDKCQIAGDLPSALFDAL